jgi:DNA-binding GntR family transcriptional regulator
MIEPVNVTSLRTAIVDQLREVILSGSVPPGERINETLLAEQFGVSRPPLREAIRQLESEALLVAHPRRGTRVRTFSPEDVRELYALRYALEAAAAEFISETHTSGMLRDLERQLDEVNATVPEGVQHTIAADLRFHREIVRAAGMGRLLKEWEQLVREMRLALIYVDPEFFNVDFVEGTHRPLVEAIKARDTQAIRRYTAEIRKVGDALADRWEELQISKGK